MGLAVAEAGDKPRPTDSQVKASEEAFREATSEESPSDSGDGLPAVDFTTFVLSLTHSALVYLGDAPDPATGKPNVNLAIARQSIDTLALLQEKTRGNLEGSEEHVLSQALFDLRMRYVEVRKKSE